MNESRKRQLLVVLLGMTVVPAFLLLPFPETLTLATGMTWLADSLGYVGIVLLLWLYILGTKSVMGLVFTDLAPVLHLHKTLGKYGPLAIFAHPLLLISSYGTSLLFPNIATEFYRHVLLGQIALYVVLLTWGVSWFLKKRMAFRPWKYLHYLAYIALPFALLHVPDVGSNYMSEPLVKAYFFVLVVTFIIFLVIRTRGVLNLDKSRYEVVSHIKITDTDYVLNLKALGTSRLRPQRGQYVYLKLGFISEDHPFSVLQYDESNNSIALGYRVFGSYTKVMEQLKKQDTVYLGGPYGSFMSEIDTSDRPLVYLAGGIGITPFVDQIFHNAGKREQWLFAANRSRESAVLVPQVAGKLGPNLVRIYNEVVQNLQPGEENGFITAELLRKYLGEDLNRYTFYLCGPPVMMKVMSRVLSEAGLPGNQVHSEKFGW